MELDLFKAFVAVAEVRSFRRAAGNLYVSQPTISRQIARLERELGTQLFERYGRHVECTLSGQFLLPLAQSIIARTDETVSLMREQAGAGLTGARFGATGMVFAHLLLPIVTRFITAYPTVKLDLVEREDVRLEERVISGELDCAVITSWGPTRAATKHLLAEEFVLVVARGHPLASLPAVALSALANEPLLFPGPDMNVSNVLADACRRAGFEPRIAYRANYPELLRNLVRAGLGVLPIVTSLSAPEDLGELVAIPFRERVVRDLVLIYPWDRPLPAAARTLMALIQTGVSSMTANSAKPRERSDRSRRPRRTVDKAPGHPTL